MNIVGINTGHNGSLALVQEGKLTFYIEEERLTRYKYDGNPFRALLEILYNYTIDEVVVGGTYDLKNSILPWTLENPYEALVRKVSPHTKVTTTSTDHHLSHAASAFYGSGFEEAIVIVIDGAGSLHNINIQSSSEYGYEIESVYVCTFPNTFKIFKKTYARNPKDANITYIKDTNNIFHCSSGITKTYEAVTNYLGFGFIEAGKTMGLASYGSANEEIPDLLIAGRGNNNIINSAYPAGAIIDKEANTLFHKGSKSTTWHYDEKYFNRFDADIARKAQEQTQEAVVNIIKEVVEKTGIKNVCISGGYALNCVANYYYKKILPDINLYIDPIAHDGGTAIGLAKYAWYRHANNQTIKNPLKSLYLGKHYSSVDLGIYANDIISKSVSYDQIAKLISDKNIVAIFQGRSEAGPRALGNRSILYDPRDVEGKNEVNKVKGREWFRPFAASVLEKNATEYFDMSGLVVSPFMMYAVDAKLEKIKEIPAVLHVDNTCRVQTVNRDDNIHFYNLIDSFYTLTGVPMLLNTSFNLAGEPLVETLEDALRTLFSSRLQYLYLPEHSILLKKRANI